MKSLIIYATQHGCTEKCALALKEQLIGETELCRIGKAKVPNLEQFDQIIIGGSIHMGKIQSKLQRLMADTGLLLMNKRLGLYLCCMYEGQVAIDQFNNAFPEALRQLAKSKGIFGGEFNFERMNLLERFITSRVAHVTSSQSKIIFAEIEKFAYVLNH